MPMMERIGANEWQKVCTRCNTAFTFKTVLWNDAREGFRKYFASSYSNRRPDELQVQCKSCDNDRISGRKSKVHREAVLQAQGNKCGICCIEISFANNSAYIDHDHDSGETRKALCNGCNLKMAGIDNDEWLAKAIAYRDEYRK